MELDIEEFKSYAPIIPYVKQFYKDKIPITKESKNVAFARCIFHQENTASLAFFASGKYKCFGCGAHGDIIDLVKHMENLDFKEACMEIGKNVGHEVEFEPPNPHWQAYKEQLDNHSRRYWGNLQKDADALNYVLNTRRISPEMIDLFRLGLTDDSEFKFRTDIGNISHKLVFPILEHSLKPHAVGMAYRGFTDEKPKYINDSNQEGREGQRPELAGVFIKSNMLYGMSQARKTIAHQDCVIVTEGYFDVISMHQSGMTNTVGLMGVNMSDAQADEIAKRASRVILMLDSDNAGLNGTMNAVSKMFQRGMTVHVCRMPDYHDADELCKSKDFNLNEVGRYVKSNMQNAYLFIANMLTMPYENYVVNERMRIMEKAEEFGNLLSGSQKDVFMSTIRKRIDI